MSRYGILFTITMMAACGAAQTTTGAGSGSAGSGYVDCDGVQCGTPATCVAVVGMTPEQTKHSCVLKCHEDSECPKGPPAQTCQHVHDIGLVCQVGDN